MKRRRLKPIHTRIEVETAVAGVNIAAGKIGNAIITQLKLAIRARLKPRRTKIKVALRSLMLAKHGPGSHARDARVVAIEGATEEVEVANKKAKLSPKVSRGLKIHR